jgi:hypothetical protein
VVVVLADGARCGKVPDIDPMSAKRREFPRAGTVMSIPVGKQFRAYIMSLSGGSSFWLFDFLTTERVCDRSLFEFSRWKKFFYFDGGGLPPDYVDELQIKLSDAEMRRPPTWERVCDWELERKEVPTPYRVMTHEHVEFYAEEDQLSEYQECVLLSHKELVEYIKANLEEFQVITPREDQLSSPVETLPVVATFTPGCIYEIWLSGLEQMEMTDVEEIGEEIDDELEEHEAGEVIGVGGTTEEQYNIAVQCEPGMNRKALGCIRRVLKRLKANPETTDIWVQGESEKKLGLK